MVVQLVAKPILRGKVFVLPLPVEAPSGF
jgi:hypothetical protein